VCACVCVCVQESELKKKDQPTPPGSRCKREKSDQWVSGSSQQAGEVSGRGSREGYCGPAGEGRTLPFTTGAISTCLQGNNNSCTVAPGPGTCSSRILKLPDRSSTVCSRALSLSRLGLTTLSGLPWLPNNLNRIPKKLLDTTL
jgi:hypothetical protein